MLGMNCVSHYIPGTHRTKNESSANVAIAITYKSVSVSLVISVSYPGCMCILLGFFLTK